MFKHYLFGRKFLIRTDHQALTWLLNVRNPSTSQYCTWREELEIYDFDIEFRAGYKHTNADILSRLPECQQCEVKHTFPKNRRNVKILSDKNSSIIEENEKEHVFQLVNSSDSMKKCLEYVNGDTEEKFIRRNIKDLYFEKDKLFIKVDGRKLCYPKKNERDLLITSFHRDYCHLGIERIYNILRASHYWPGMKSDITIVINACQQCIMHKNNRSNCKIPIQQSKARFPFQQVAIDITGPLPRTKQSNTYILSIIDYFSKYIACVPIKDMSTKTIASKLINRWFTIFGVPESLHSDCGTTFKSELFQELLKMLGCKKTFTCPYYPQSDGLVERVFRTIKPLLKATTAQNTGEWDTLLPWLNFALNNTIQSSINFSPNEVIFGNRLKAMHLGSKVDVKANSPFEYVNELKHKLNFVHKEVKKNAEKSRAKIAMYYNRHKNKEIKTLQLGDIVFVENKVRKSFYDPKFKGPFEVIKIIAPFRYLLKEQASGKIIQRNHNQIKHKRYHGNENIKPQSIATTIISRKGYKTPPSFIKHRIPEEVKERQGILLDNEMQPNMPDISRQRNLNIANKKIYPQRIRHKPEKYGFG